jgi:hypothetical protein
MNTRLLRLRHTVLVRLHSDESGTIALMTAFLLMAMMGMLALTVDIGYAYGEQRQAQNVADSAAVAGTKVIAEYLQTGSQTRYTDAMVLNAMRDAARKSSGDFIIRNTSGIVVERFSGVYVDVLLNSLGVTVGSAPGGAIPSQARGIRVTPAKPVETFFASVLGKNVLDIGARATGKTSTIIGLHPGMYGPYVLWAGEDAYICKDGAGNPIPDPKPPKIDDVPISPAWQYGCNLYGPTGQEGSELNYRCNNYSSCAVSRNNPRWRYNSNDFKGYLHQSNTYIEVSQSSEFDVQGGNAVGGASDPLDALENCYLRREQGCTVAMPVIDWAESSSGGIKLRVIKFVNVKLTINPKGLAPSVPWTGRPVPGSLIFSAGKAVISDLTPAPGEATVQYVRLVQ